MSNKSFANDEGLGQSSLSRLDRIFQTNTPLGSVTQQIFKTIKSSWCSNDKDMSDTGKH